VGCDEKKQKGGDCVNDILNGANSFNDCKHGSDMNEKIHTAGINFQAAQMERDCRDRETKHLNKISRLNRISKFMMRDINLLSILGQDHDKFADLLKEVLVQCNKEETMEQEQLENEKKSTKLGDYEALLHQWPSVATP
jgi:hypothetical protein